MNNNELILKNEKGEVILHLKKDSEGKVFFYSVGERIYIKPKKIKEDCYRLEYYKMIPFTNGYINKIDDTYMELNYNTLSWIHKVEKEHYYNKYMSIILPVLGEYRELCLFLNIKNDEDIKTIIEK